MNSTTFVPKIRQAAGLILCALCLTTPSLARAENAPDTQRTFASANEATNGLIAATKAHDHMAVRAIFGPDATNLMTGDKALDERHFDNFARELSEQCALKNDDASHITLEIGAEHWPFPIPLVQTNGSWMFDTAAGEEEIINRHIGHDEFYAIGVCRAYVKAQQAYAAHFAESNGPPAFAQRFKSEPGKENGLFWPSDSGAASPLSNLLGEAAWEGYHWSSGKGPHPFHGYYFKILTRQGNAAIGGKLDYIEHGKMTGGFALVAYPERWGESGVMTFVVNQEGAVYQRSLGPDTVKLARKITEYNPDAAWTIVNEEGITDLAGGESAAKMPK